MNFKEIEKKRYNDFHKEKELEILELKTIGYESVSYAISSPYEYYHEKLQRLSKNCKTHLDICCGDGRHSFTTARLGCNVTALDFSSSSIKIANKRAKVLNCNVKFICCDFEEFEIPENSLDIISIVGSLSYLNLEYFISFCNKALKEEGHLIILDSFDYNPIYRINRFMHFLKGNRSRFVNTQIPNISTLKKIHSDFAIKEKKFFGTFTFLYPLLVKFLSEDKIKVLLDYLDKLLPSTLGFKFVLVAQKHNTKNLTA